jgi:His-Xaa-Ser system radical SAM maturase HxsC
MRSAQAQFLSPASSCVRRVETISSLARHWTKDLNYAVLAKEPHDFECIERLRANGLQNLVAVASPDLQEGDVIAPPTITGKVVVVYRRSDQHHSVFLTNRCNSNCLMCSQPPTAEDDSWLVEEAIEVAHHMGESPACIGLTGGEPLLLGSALRRLLQVFSELHPESQLEVLTNGRLLARPDVRQEVLEGMSHPVRWLVPLYGHADFLHDFVVQAPGAFDETVLGLLALQAHHQPIQLRVVLIEPVLRILPELCEFLGRNFPFVQTVALMGVEPIGFALANRVHCEVNLADWEEALTVAAGALQRHRVPYVFMNVPQCALPPALRPHACRSISDWKRVYATECEGCAAKQDCCGLFAWHERGWKPTTLRPLAEAIA